MIANARISGLFIAAALLILMAALCLQCTDKPTQSPPTSEPIDLTESEKALIESDNSFGLNLFREIVAEEKDKNIFISPLSVSMALGMTYNGANGATRETMEATLELSDLTMEEVNASYQHLISALMRIDPEVKMHLANSIWYLPSRHPVDSFLDVCIEYFNAQVTGIDFSDPQAAPIINGWVEENTNGKIKDIVEDPIDPLTVLILINAIYFKGTWTYQFDAEQTQDETFYLSDGSEIQVPMMAQRSLFRNYANDEFQAVELPYGDGTFSMTIFLPNYWADIDALIEKFEPETLDSWMGSFSSDSLDIFLPKFTLEYELKLNDVLTVLGMGIAFTPGMADFSNMFPGGGPWISKVMHKSFVEVNEEGTEAAAATSVHFFESGISGEFRVNRPFLFMIRENETETILFIGKVMDPTDE